MRGELPMPDLTLILRVCLWLLSFSGISAFTARTLRLKPEAAPFVALSFLSVLLTFSGMLDALNIISCAAYVSGFAFLLFEIVFRRKAFLKSLRPAALIAVFVWIIYLFARLKNYLPYENDDLSHWALVARELLRTNAFPNASTEILIFSGYPLASAVNIYYFCRFIGENEWLFAFAQAFYRLIAFLPLLALIRKNRLFGYISFALAFLFISRAGGYIVSLRVDPLLTAFGIASFSCLLIAEKEKARPIAALLPAAMMMTLTKNSGIFFAIIIFLAIAFMNGKRFGRKSGIITFLTGAGASALTLGAWLFYVKRVFPSGLSSKHAVNLTAYLANAAEKGVSAASKIARAFLSALFSPLPSDLMIYALFFLALSIMGILIALFRKRGLIKPLSGLLAFLCGTYAAWLLSLYCMYIVSMPSKEALAAASFTRYHRTITLFMGGSALAFVYKVTCHDKIVFDRTRKITVSVVLLLLFALTAISHLLDTRSGVILSSRQDRSDRRREIIAQREKYGVEDGKAYLIFASPDESTTENNTDSIYYLYKYEFSSIKIGLIYESDEQDGMYIYHTYDNKRQPKALEEILPAVSDTFDYLIFHEQDADFEKRVLALEENIDMKIVLPD